MTVPRLLLLMLILLATGCGENAPPPMLPTTAMQIGSAAYTIEIARTDADRRQGLSDRPALPAGRGMIFVFADEAPRSFWMKNVPFGLDIIFLNARGTVVEVKTMLAYDLRQTVCAKPAKYAIEIPAGAATEAGVKIGDTIAIPEVAREPAAE